MSWVSHFEQILAGIVAYKDAGHVVESGFGIAKLVQNFDLAKAMQVNLYGWAPVLPIHTGYSLHLHIQATTCLRHPKDC